MNCFLFLSVISTFFLFNAVKMLCVQRSMNRWRSQTDMCKISGVQRFMWNKCSSPRTDSRGSRKDTRPSDRKIHLIWKHEQCEESWSQRRRGCWDSWSHTYHRKPNFFRSVSSRGRRLKSSSVMGDTQRSVWNIFSPTWNTSQRSVRRSALEHSQNSVEHASEPSSRERPSWWPLPPPDSPGASVASCRRNNTLPHQPEKQRRQSLS